MRASYYRGGRAAYRKEEAPPIQSAPGLKALFGAETIPEHAIAMTLRAHETDETADGRAVSMQAQYGRLD